LLRADEIAPDHHLLHVHIASLGAAGRGQFAPGENRGKEIEELKNRVEQPEGKKQDILERAERAEALVFRIGAADVKQPAIRKHLRGEVIVPGFLEQRGHLASFDIELLNAERPQLQKLSPVIPADPGGLENNFPSFARQPSRRGVERIAFRQLLDSAFPVHFDPDIGGAIFVEHAEHHVPGGTGDRDVADLGAIVIPQPAFLDAQPADFQQGAQAAALQRIDESVGLPGAADARDDQGNVSDLRGFAPQHRAGKRRPVIAGGFPRMFLLGTHRFFTEGIAEDAVNGAWRFIPRFDANFPLRQVGNVQL
jgi:hypothetical protein